MDDGRWITLKDGRRVKIKTTSEYMNDLIRNEAKTKVINEKRKNELKEELKKQSENLKNFIDTYGYNLNDYLAQKYNEIHSRVEDLRYELEKNYYKEITEQNIKKERLTGFDPSIYVQARKDDLKNYNVYKALSNATAGVGINRNTAVDDILEGKNSNVSPKELYDTFKDTRNQLKNKYGNEITLYRVETQQMKKPTKNYGSSIKYTKQYGDDVKKYNVKVDDIVAIFTNRSGTYEDVIVAVDGINKYIK